MYPKLTLFALSLVLLSHCKSQNIGNEKAENKTPQTSEDTKTSQNAANVDKNGNIYIKEGETLQFADLKMNITFKGITEDSRCPEGVQCVWQGAAVAKVEFLSVHARPKTVDLATVNIEGRGYYQNAVYDGYSFTLKSVTPSKEKRSAENPYTIHLKVEKYTGENPKTNPEVSPKAASSTTK